MFIECFVLKRHTFHASMHQWDENRINFGVHFYCYKIKIDRIACFKCAYLVKIQFTFQLTFYVHSWAFTFAINLKFDCVKPLFSSGFLSAPSYRKEIIDEFKRRRFLCHNFYTVKYKPIFMTHLTADIIYDMPNLFWLCIFDVDCFKWYFFC